MSILSILSPLLTCCDECELQASPSFASLLSNILSTHTSHSRSLSLAALYSSTSGSKPTKAVPRNQVGLVVAAEAAGEGEGESLEGGKVWRFGALPIR